MNFILNNNFLHTLPNQLCRVFVDSKEVEGAYGEHHGDRTHQSQQR